MKRLSPAVILAALAGSFAFVRAAGPPESGVVVAVYDGDTVTVEVDGATGVKRERVRLLGIDAPEIKYHYTSCPAARRISAAHRRTFASAAEARAADYVPCKLCRPPRE